MKGRSRFIVLLAVLLGVAIACYLYSVRGSGDLQLIGIVDANEVVVSSRVPGKIETLNVQEGDKVQAGEVIATIQSQDLLAASEAAQATAESSKYKLLGSRDTERQMEGQTGNQVVNARAELRAARAALAQAQAQYDRQKADTSRTVALARQGIDSAQARDEDVASLEAARAAVQSAIETVSADEAAVKVAIANRNQARAAAQTRMATSQDMKNAQALLDESKVELGYAQVVSPVTGIVDVRASLQGEVVSAGTPIVTVVDLTQTWVYAPLPETEADAVQVGDRLRVVMPSGTTTYGKVIAKLVEGDFATQRDVSRNKRDIKTVSLKLLIDNPGMRYVPGMTAEVYIPKKKLVRQ